MTEVGPGILWTAMPLELVTAGLEESLPAVVDLQIDGRLVQVVPSGDGTGVVQRLISTDPGDYLDARWQPGVVVALTQTLG